MRQGESILLEYSSTPSQCSPAPPFNLCDRVDLLAESTRRIRRQQCNPVNRHLHRKYKYVCNKIQIEIQVQQVQGSEPSARNTAILAVATKNSRIIRESVGMHQWRCTWRRRGPSSVPPPLPTCSASELPCAVRLSARSQCGVAPVAVFVWLPGG